MSFLGTLIRPRNGTAASTTPDTRVNAPVYSPAFMFRQPVASRVQLLPEDQHILYERGTLIKPPPGQVLPLRNSLFQPMQRGPIRDVFTRQWYWRHPQPQSDELMPNGHVLIADGLYKNMPGRSGMTPASRLTFNLRTPAWSTANIKTAQGEGTSA